MTPLIYYCNSKYMIDNYRIRFIMYAYPWEFWIGEGAFSILPSFEIKIFYANETHWIRISALM